MADYQRVRDSFEVQAGWCDRLGSPFTARLLAGLATRLDQNSATGTRILQWRGQPDATGDAVALRLAGALNALVRAQHLPDLARFYPPYELPKIDVLADAAMIAIDRRDEEICSFLDNAPQTNEVARSAILYCGIRYLAGQTGLPLKLFELGSSAGLNLLPDKYCYRFDGHDYGQSGSSVRLSPNWSGTQPGGKDPRIVARRGCDLNPLDIRNLITRSRLLAYIWADQAERISRAEAALNIALPSPPQVDKMDAAEWIAKHIDLTPEHGVVRVVFHSIAQQYFPPDVQKRIEKHIETAGEAATSDAGLAWLAFEQVPDLGPCLSLRLWNGEGGNNGRAVILAKAADAHCRGITWLA